MSMKLGRLVVALVVCTQLQGCLFFYIPGEAIDGVKKLFKAKPPPPKPAGLMTAAVRDSLE
jgi:hypothetical protein